MDAARSRRRAGRDRASAEGRSPAGDDVPLERTAIVYKNPLPYLYAAAEIFRGAGIPYQMSDALPLAAEPTSAALDLMLDAVSSRFSRSALIALLRSPHFDFGATTST